MTEKLIADVAAGKDLPWRREWDVTKCGPNRVPINACTGKRYRGINRIIFASDDRVHMTGDPRWATRRQAEQAGWAIRDGETPMVGIVWKPAVERQAGADASPEPAGIEGEESHRGFYSTFLVFHASQIEAIPQLELAPPPAWMKPQAILDMAAGLGIRMLEGGTRAFYSPRLDQIMLPPAGAFSSPEAWAGAGAHELGHGTGADKPGRLNRTIQNKFGSELYAREELVAEMSSMMMLQELGLSCGGIPQGHVNYIADWLRVFKSPEGPAFLRSVVPDAEKAAKLCLSQLPEWIAMQEAEATIDAREASGGNERKPPVRTAAAAEIKPGEGLKAALAADQRANGKLEAAALAKPDRAAELAAAACPKHDAAMQAEAALAKDGADVRRIADGASVSRDAWFGEQAEKLGSWASAAEKAGKPEAAAKCRELIGAISLQHEASCLKAASWKLSASNGGARGLENAALSARAKLATEAKEMAENRVFAAIPEASHVSGLAEALAADSQMNAETKKAAKGKTAQREAAKAIEASGERNAKWLGIAAKHYAMAGLAEAAGAPEAAEHWLKAEAAQLRLAGMALNAAAGKCSSSKDPRKAEWKALASASHTEAKAISAGLTADGPEQEAEAPSPAAPAPAAEPVRRPMAAPAPAARAAAAAEHSACL